MQKGSFEWALTGLRKGGVMRRSGWTGFDSIAMWSAPIGMLSGFIGYARKGSGAPEPWVPTSDDLLAFDWFEDSTNVMDFDAPIAEKD